MTDDFERVRESAMTSAIAHRGRRLVSVASTAWPTSVIGRWWTRTRELFARATPAARLRWWAITISVAAIAHVALRSLMSSTVAPAAPLAVYLVLAGAGVAIAWQADACHRAWRASRLRAFAKPSSHDRH